MDRHVPPAYRSRRLRYRIAHNRPASSAGIEIPGCWSPAPSVPLLCCGSTSWRTHSQRSTSCCQFPKKPPSFLTGNPTRRCPSLGDDLDCINVAENEDVLVTVENGVGLITLNRPKAINSLTRSMVNAISTVLTGWEHDDEVRTVVVSGAGERGLCAGGDIVVIYRSARGDGSEARQ